MSELLQVKKLYEQKRYQAVISLYNDELKREQFTDWDFLFLLLSYTKLKQYDECLSAYKAYTAENRKSTTEAEEPEDTNQRAKQGIENAAARALYLGRIKTCDPKRCDIARLKSQLAFIIGHEEHDSQYSIVWPAMEIVMKAVGEQRDTDVNKEQLEILDMIDPGMLYSIENSYVKDGKIVSVASPRENWYAAKIPLLYRNKQYAECIQCVDSAVKEPMILHYNNQVWFRRRKAESLACLGQTDEARSLLLKLAAQLPSEWIYKDLFELEWAAGDADKALLYGCKCASIGKAGDSMTGFSGNFARFLKDQGRNEMAVLEQRLYMLLLDKTGGKMKSSDEWPLPEKTMKLDERQVIADLSPMWFEVIDSFKEFFEGTIVRINADKRLGNILGQDGKELFFWYKDVRTPKDIRVGGKVRYAVEKRLDKKKQIWSMNATDITVIG